MQANLSQPLGVYLLAAGVLFVVGFALASFATWWFIVRLAAGFILGAIPILYIYIMKSKRLAKFEEQLPEALDMMARSLRAGHAFTGALQMVGQEFDEPLGPEFTKTLNEINYGMGLGGGIAEPCRPHRQRRFETYLSSPFPSSGKAAAIWRKSWKTSAVSSASVLFLKDKSRPCPAKRGFPPISSSASPF